LFSQGIEKEPFGGNFRLPANQANLAWGSIQFVIHLFKKNMGLFSALLGNAGAVSQEELQKKYGELLTTGEEIELGFKLVRDTFIFTNKRLILVDIQGITGSKTEYTSISYKSISRFSVETAGTFELDAELKIWISSEVHPSIKKQFNKSVNVYEVQRVLAHHVLK
jgi:hypothetical protein